MTDKLEFKVGDKVEVMREGMERKIPVGRVAIVAKVDVHDHDYPYHVRYGTVLDWFTPADLQAYRNPYAVVEAADCSATAAIAVKQTLDLYTAKFICEKWAAVVDDEGTSDAGTVAIFTGYLAGLVAGLQGDKVD